MTADLADYLEARAYEGHYGDRNSPKARSVAAVVNLWRAAGAAERSLDVTKGGPCLRLVTAERVETFREAMLALVQPYADREDFNPEWRLRLGAK